MNLLYTTKKILKSLENDRKTENNRADESDQSDPLLIVMVTKYESESAYPLFPYSNGSTRGCIERLRRFTLHDRCGRRGCR